MQSNSQRRRGLTPASVGVRPGVYQGQVQGQGLLSNPSQASRGKRRVHENEGGSVHGDSVSEVIDADDAEAEEGQ